MGTTQTTPTLAQEKAQKQIFDLASFDSLTLVKMFTPAPPVTDLQSALAALGNDQGKLLAVINKGLAANYREDVRASADGWMVEDEDGKLVPFEGNAVDETMEKKIQATVLTLAKLNGYDKSLPLEKRNALKANAMELIRNTPAILASIQKQ